MSDDLIHSPPPKGFTITSHDGHPAILHRTTGMGCLLAFFVVFLLVWTTITIVFTWGIVLQEKLTAGHIVMIVGFWWGELCLIGFAAWQFGKVTRITFYPDQLQIVRAVGPIRFTNTVAKQKIESIFQWKDGGESRRDTFDSWGLYVKVRYDQIPLITKQEFEKSCWLGPIVAKWAGVEFVPAEKRKYEEI